LSDFTNLTFRTHSLDFPLKFRTKNFVDRTAKTGRQKRPVRFSHRIFSFRSPRIQQGSDRPEPTRIEAHRLIGMEAAEAIVPATHARFMPLVAPVVRCRAVVAVAYDRFVHAIIVVAHDRPRIYIHRRSLRARCSTEA